MNISDDSHCGVFGSGDGIDGVTMEERETPEMILSKISTVSIYTMKMIDLNPTYIKA